jgi:hypothetical protein
LSQQTSHWKWTRFQQSTVAQGVLAPSAGYGAQFDFRLPEASVELKATSVDSYTVKMESFVSQGSYIERNPYADYKIIKNQSIAAVGHIFNR